ncbi:hypothetical protein ACETIH_23885 [Microvirga arabica]|uniref:Uncharacterized protein n=1 Tax=Microvirga arabica TaxID=1128671 RepID=A0ABV6YEG6_9HYPH
MMVFQFAAFARPAWIKPVPEWLRNVAGAACLGLGLMGSPAAAQGGERDWHLTAYGSQWVNADLLEIPERSLMGSLRSEDAYFVGAGLSRVIVPSFSIPLLGTNFAVPGNRIELEGQVLRHFGEQSHWEGTIALMFRTGQIPLFGGLSVNLAFGEGLSYASERPALEGSFRVERPASSTISPSRRSSPMRRCPACTSSRGSITAPGSSG